MSNPVFGNNGERLNAASKDYATFNTETPDAAELNDMYNAPAYTPARYMTLDDVIVRTASMLGVIILTGAVAWIGKLDALAIPAALVGLGLALFITFKQKMNAGLILAYAACEGVFLGSISRLFEQAYEGIVVQAVVGTGGVFAGMLIVYKTGAIRVTPKMTRLVVGALFGVLAVMLVNVIGSLIVGHDALGIRDGGPIAIIFSLVCIGLAAMSFLLDFDMIDNALRRGVPEKFAWYAAFGLTVTLVWLYLEILRLIGYARD